MPSVRLASFDNGGTLYIRDNGLSNWKDDIENTEWLDLLFPFTAVKNLYLSVNFSSRIATALQELSGGRTTEVLPALKNVLLDRFQPWEPDCLRRHYATACQSPCRHFFLG